MMPDTLTGMVERFKKQMGVRPSRLKWGVMRIFDNYYAHIAY